MLADLTCERQDGKVKVGAGCKPWCSYATGALKGQMCSKVAARARVCMQVKVIVCVEEVLGW